MDDDLENKGYKGYMASIDARIGNTKVSQPALAAPLESSSQPTRFAHPAPKNHHLTQLPNLRIPLTKKPACLSHFSPWRPLRSALALLTKFCWLVDAYPEILHLFIHMMKHSRVAL